MSQRHLGWTVIAEQYDDGGYTGGNLERPALQKLLTDLTAGKIDCVVIYKVDRLSRSLLDFARLMEIFEQHGFSLVSVTQPLNATSSLGRLTLNILLSFAQFEREIIADRGARASKNDSVRLWRWSRHAVSNSTFPNVSKPACENPYVARQKWQAPSWLNQRQAAENAQKK